MNAAKAVCRPQDRARAGRQTYDGSRGGGAWSTMVRSASRICELLLAANPSVGLYSMLRFRGEKNGVAMSLPDIRARFLFPPMRTQGNFSYKEASADLGVPGHVATNRLVSSQTAMSKGTGEH